MAISYIPPGVTSVTELQSSGLAPSTASINIPCLVGRARGYQSATDTLVLTGTDPVSLSKTGYVGNPIVTLGLTNETVTAPNFTITTTSPSGGVTEGDDVTTIQRVALPSAPTLSQPTGTALTGTYRYAVTFVDTSISGAPNETGLDSSTAPSITVSGKAITVSDIALGPDNNYNRKLYRSKNLGSANLPVWGPWYLVTTLTDNTTTSYVDSALDATVAANPTAPPGILSGDTVKVSYQYADVDYFKPTMFSNGDFNSIIDKYGEPFDTSGGINCELSFAAKLCMVNGANTVILMAVKPSTGDTPSSQDIADAMPDLVDEFDATIIVAIDGSTVANSAVAAHVQTMNNSSKFRVGLLARDGTGTPISPDELRNNALAFGATSTGSSLEMYSPSIFRYYNGFTSREVPIGGQYFAAAAAGMWAARNPSQSLTRQVAAGFSSVGESRTELAKNLDARAGLTVVESFGGVLRIRHAISTDPSSINTREFTVTLSKQDMVRDVIAVLESAVIGKVQNDSMAPVIITSYVTGVLDTKVAQRRIQSYAGLTVTGNANDPTAVDVRWEYKPLYTINYITITIGLNLNTGVAGITTGLGGATGQIL